VNIGVLPNVDKVSFLGDLGLGSRTLSQTISQNGVQIKDDSRTGLEGEVNLGVSIPAGPIRIVPKSTIGIGSFSSQDSTTAASGSVRQSLDIPESGRSPHVFVLLGIAGYYSIDFGSKTPPP
jgi:hypothetical protein